MLKRRAAREGEVEAESGAEGEVDPEDCVLRLGADGLGPDSVADGVDGFDDLGCGACWCEELGSGEAGGVDAVFQVGAEGVGGVDEEPAGEVAAGLGGGDGGGAAEAAAPMMAMRMEPPFRAEIHVRRFDPVRGHGPSRGNFNRRSLFSLPDR